MLFSFFEHTFVGNSH